MRKLSLPFIFILFLLQACNLPLGSPAQAEPARTQPFLSPVASRTRAPTLTYAPSRTPTASQTPIPSLTPTLTLTAGPSLTPTFAFPVVTVNMQAHCRYGPNIAYLHAADLYPGDKGTVRGRFRLSKWLFVKFDKLKYFCWVAPSVVDVSGDVTTVKFTEPTLPGPSVLYKPPQNVLATRDGKNVTITWDVVPMTKDDDRGYFLDIFVCQGKAYLWYPVALDNRDLNSYRIKDEAGCPAPSGGKLYAVEKHGYTRPVTIDWPEP
ncbi:MAG TPA: hypothetical protein VGK00_03965 [Anaerolineales bacterium]|jgi:hypothetical protein